MDGYKLKNNFDNSASTKNIAVLASGSGSNLGALINAVNSKVIENANISLVISNKADSYALTRAKNANIPAVHIAKNLYNSDEDYDLALIKKLNEYKIDVVLLAGYLRIITKPFINAYENKILNIHPSLLPDFGGKGMYGIKVHQAVLNANAKISGCTVHLVTEKIDEGPILAQSTVSVLPDDTEETLAAKVLAEEHKLYPKTVNNYISSIILNN